MGWKGRSSGSAALRLTRPRQTQHKQHESHQQRSAARHQPQPEQRHRRQPRETPHVTLLHPRRKLLVPLAPGSALF